MWNRIIKNLNLTKSFSFFLFAFLFTICNPIVEDKSDIALTSFLQRVKPDRTTNAGIVEIVDLTPPIVGSIGIGTINPTSIAFNWTAATDDITLQSNIQYLAYYSLNNNLTSVTDIESNGTPIGAFTPNALQSVVSGLAINTNYFLTVIAKDEKGNKSAYPSVSATTTLDTTPPSAGNAGVVTTSNISSTGMTINWTAATDNATLQSNLQYKVVYSLSNNIGTVVTAEANGTLAQDWSANITSKIISGLTMNTNYYFTVLVQDLSLNKTSYSVVNSTTLACAPGSGISAAGYIWYLGCQNTTCNAVCASRGGVSAGYSFIGGSTTNCQTILDAVGLGTGSVASNFCAQGAGCYINPARTLCTSPAFDPNFSSPSDIKVCSCVN